MHPRPDPIAGAFFCLLAWISPLAAEDAQTAVEEPSRRPLMALLGAPGLAHPLEEAKLNVFGFVQSSWTRDFDAVDDAALFGRVFDFKHDDVMLNQLDLAIERTVDLTRTQWDVGGRVEMIYGEDSGTIHSSGDFDWYRMWRGKGDAFNSPVDQWDLNQFYLDVSLPVGHGLRLRGGKYVTPLGWETINPTTNPFLSHSYLFAFATPFTHTGAMATWQITDRWQIEACVFRGWEQTFKDNNDANSFNVNGLYTSADQKWNLTGKLVTGPEEKRNSRDWRTVFDLIVSYAWTDKATIGLNADLGSEQGIARGGTQDAWWYGNACYGQYKLSDYVTVNARAEWFRDEEGVRTGVAGDYSEATLGATVHPFPHDNLGKNVFLRPEVRGDWATHGVFDDGDRSMFTTGIDVILTF